MLSPAERIFCVTVYLLTAAVGYISCLYVLVYAIFHSKRRSSFVTVCVYKCALNFLVLTGFLFCIGPLIVLNISAEFDTPTEILSRIQFAIVTSVYEAQLWVCLLLAVNRFVAIVFWNYYERLFNIKIVYIALAVITAFKLWHGYEDYFVRIIFRGDTISWDMLDPPTDGIVYDVFALIGAATVLNLLTLAYVVFHAVIRHSTAISPSKRVKDNSLLFLQAFFQDLVFPIDITCMFILVGYWDNPIFQFVCSNYTSLLVHAIDGPIMLAFQRHMLRPIKKLIGGQKEGPPSSWANPRSTGQTYRQT